jgi:hypothetical protein
MVKNRTQNGLYACIYSHIESKPDCQDKFVSARFAVYSGDKIVWGSFIHCTEVFWGTVPAFFSQCDDQSCVKNRQGFKGLRLEHLA